MNENTLNQMQIGDIVHSDLDDTTYVIRIADGFAVCDNGEEVIVSTASAAMRIILENAEANN